MKIVFFDFYTNGHHLKYAGELISYFQKKKHEVMLVVLYKDERVLKLTKDNPRLKIKALFKKEIKLEERNIFKKIFQQINILKRVFKEVADSKADIFHLLYLDSIIPIYFALPKKKSFKFIITSFWLPLVICINKNHCTRQKFYNRVNGYFLKKLFRKNKIDRILGHNVNPKDLKNLLANYSSLTNQDLEKISFIYDPIYELYYKVADQKRARVKLNLPSNVPILLMFGELTKGKGLDILIEAIKISKKRLCLVIAGKPHFFTKEIIDGYKATLSKNQSILDQLGFVPEEDVPYYYLACDCVIMPYRLEYAMGTSGVLMQACSAKRPTIASDVGAIGSLIKERNLGITVKPENAKSLAKGITRFLDHKKFYSNKIEKSVDSYLSEASWKAVAPLIEKIYREVEG